MFLKHLNILYFKNIEERQFDFSKKIIAFVGLNGVGKTNILDAIYYLAMTKSYFSSSDVQNIQQGKEFFVLQGKFEKNGQWLDVNCSVKRSEGKNVSFNQKAYTRISEHIGKIPIVFIAPQDSFLITDYADTRRKFLDALISKFDRDYLNALIQYYHALQNRNNIIKQGEVAYQQQDLIDVYNSQMAQTGELILNKRRQFFDEIKDVLKTTYSQLQDNQENLELVYTSTIQKDFFKELQHSLPKDIRMGYTTIGVHRDDFDILLNQYPAKNFASQGQQKTIIFAIKWVELFYLYSKTNIHPILLIDDIYDRLDEKRLSRMKTFLMNDIVGQVFVTDNHPKRIQDLFADVDIEIIELFSGLKNSNFSSSTYAGRDGKMGIGSKNTP